MGNDISKQLIDIAHQILELAKQDQAEDVGDDQEEASEGPAPLAGPAISVAIEAKKKPNSVADLKKMKADMEDKQMK